MHVTGIVHPKQISMMADLLDVRCRAAGYQKGSLERARLAAEIMMLFDAGARTAAQLASALDAAQRPQPSAAQSRDRDA